jgi:GNAT superfamily N-acetyltransferase
MSLVIRRAEPADEPFLWRMLATTAHLPPNEPPPVEAAQQDPGIAPYLRGWGRPGDAGVLAEEDGEPVGAAWYRRFAAGSPGYGFVAEDIPEISIGVEAGWRSRGTGRALLNALIDRARADGHASLSLSADARNAPALALYRSIGFETVGGDAGNPTMLLRLVG